MAANALDYNLILRNATTPPVDPLMEAAKVANFQADQRAKQQAAALAPVALQQSQANLQSTNLRNQSEELTLQQQQQDRQLMQQAIAEVGPDPDKLLQWGTGKFSLNTTAALQKLALDKASKDALIAQRDATASEKQRQTNQENLDSFSASVNSIKALPQQQRLPAWQALIDRVSTTKDPWGTPYITPGQVNRDVVPDDMGLDAIEQSISPTGYTSRKTAAQKTADETQTRADQAQSRTDAKLKRDISMFVQAAQVIDPEDPMAKQDYDELLTKFKDSDAYQYLPKKFDIDKINRLGMSPDQRAIADREAAKPDKGPTNALEATAAGIRAEHPDWAEDKVQGEAAKVMQQREIDARRASREGAGAGKDDYGFTPQQNNRDAQAVGKLHREEHEQWDLASAYKQLLDSKQDDDWVVDPASKGSAAKPMRDMRSAFQSRMQDSLHQAQSLYDQKMQLTQSHGWAGGLPTSSGTPPPPSGTPAPSAAAASPVVTQQPAAAIVPSPGQQSSPAIPPPPRPAWIPVGAKASYSRTLNAWRFSTDGGKTWQQRPAQTQ